MAGVPQSERGGISQQHSEFRVVDQSTRIPTMSVVESLSQGPEISYLPHPLDNPVARQRILDNGANPDLVGKVFDDEGRWKLRGREGDYPKLWEDSWAASVPHALIGELKPVYDLVDYNLRGEKWPHGYNRHDLEHHVFEVADATEYLLQAAGYGKSREVMRVGKLAALSHDAGNILDRRGHATKSPEIVATVVPDVLANPEEWQKAEQAMTLHDEKTLMPFIDALGDDLSPEDVIAHLRSINNPALLALVIADKSASIGRHRTNPWARSADTVNNDVHMWTNYLARGRGIRYAREAKDLKASVEFNPTISEDEYDDFVDVAVERSHHEGYRAMVPDVIQNIHRDNQVPQFLAWSGNLMNIYLDRFKLSAIAAKALFPNLEKFTIELSDQRGIRSRGGGKVIEEIHFDGHLQEQFDALDMVYGDPHVRRPEDFAQTEMIFDARNSANNAPTSPESDIH